MIRRRVLRQRHPEDGRPANGPLDCNGALHFCFTGIRLNLTVYGVVHVLNAFHSRYVYATLKTPDRGDGPEDATRK